MNLLEHPWLPVRRHSGAVERIVPSQLTEGLDSDPFVALATGRPDFDGALLEFLIGLLQTTLAPPDEKAWRSLWRKPPSPDALASAFAPYRDAFDLDGDGPRFMQDLTLDDNPNKTVGQLLIDEPGDNTLKNNTDHFVKRGRIQALSPEMAAAALYTLQTFAPSGGAGHRTSLRGGGPLTTVVLGDDLWRTCLLNVLPTETFYRQSADELPADRATVFPWLAATRTSEGGRGVLPTDCHPAQVYWGMPRRIHLRFETGPARCSISGRDLERSVRGYNTVNYGINYIGPWRHPLSPYYASKDEWLPVHAGTSGLGYAHWLGLVIADDDASSPRRPADVVHHALSSRLKLIGAAPRLLAFGFDMNNMAARCWYESTMPIIMPGSHPDDPADEEALEDLRAAYVGRIRDCIRAAREVAGFTASAVMTVNGHPAEARHAFWSETEQDFYHTLDSLLSALRASLDADLTAIAMSWRHAMRQAAERIFLRYADAGHFEGRDPAVVARAYNQLLRSILGPRVRDLLRLPAPQSSASSRNRRRPAEAGA